MACVSGTSGEQGRGVKGLALAHLFTDGSTVREHPLAKHLQSTGRLSSRFVGSLNAGDWGELLGLWHDLGKYSSAFQAYIRGRNGQEAHLENRPGRVDHSTAGAAQAASQFAKQNPFAARVLAYCLAGHHAGLPDWDTGSDASLARRLARTKPETTDALARAPQSLLEAPLGPGPRIVPAESGKECGLQIGMLVRMLFSCLTDADFLDTEAALAPHRTAGRQSGSVSIEAMRAVLNSHLKAKAATARPLPINHQRAQILQHCRNEAREQPGFFSLTVPTGGGKTLSSLAFALDHACVHNLRRVVYAVPFTSIIEQTADVFREALGPLGPSVVEHHSNIDPCRETLPNRLACENWDAPLIVTTNVQFFESLFAARTSACRKLHNLVGSVIVLDEAQTLPVEFLTPCLAALKELVRNYGCTVVLCTATQPAIHRREMFPIGIDRPREIMPDPSHLYEQMRRVRVEHVGKLDDEELQARLLAEPRVLCVVNTKRHAAKLFSALHAAGPVWHLSATMCPEHRSEKLNEIKQLLLDPAEPLCRLVSTQLIEAGVDIDFPVVYRAAAGLDSIAQAAGRCNREGLQDQGSVFVFDAEQPPPPGHLWQTAETARELLTLHDDLLSLDAMEHFFRLHYWKSKANWDRHDILNCFKLGKNYEPICDFRTAAEKFRLIPDATQPVIIPYGEQGKELVETLRADPFTSRDLRRKLQRFTVALRQRQWDDLRSQGLLDMVHDQFPVLIEMKYYDSDTGLSPPDDMIL